MKSSLKTLFLYYIIKHNTALKLNKDKGKLS